MIERRSPRATLPAALGILAALGACRAPTNADAGPVESRASAPPEPVALPDAPALPTPPRLPASVDLRDQLLAWKLPPRAQGPRGTCSVFTTCAAIEFALARERGEPRRLSVEFLNWAASQAGDAPSDGNFFHNAIAGFERFGLCADEALPYREAYDPKLTPPAQALEDASALRDASRGDLVVHWIVPWQPDRFGVSPEQLAEIRSVLSRGFPVAAGSGHSRLLVGYRDDVAREGGGVFLTEDSALARFDEVSYDFVRGQVADVFWIDALGSHAPQSDSQAMSSTGG
jgi:hypothetical protein